jgi:hypothetical protein
MKVYWLKPSEGQRWLTPEEVVARLQSSFPRVRFSAEAAQERGKKFLAKYRALLTANPNHVNPTPLNVVEHQWSGALLVEVWADPEGVARFQTIAFTEHRLELEFGAGVPPRNRRALAKDAAQALGYTLETVDGD